MTFFRIVKNKFMIFRVQNAFFVMIFFTFAPLKIRKNLIIYQLKNYEIKSPN